MDLNLLKQVFPEDRFIIETQYSDDDEDDPMIIPGSVDIKTKEGSKEKVCANIFVKGKKLTVDLLSKCGITGKETLHKIEEFARRAEYEEIHLEDMSDITICDTEYDLAVLH